MGYAHITNLYRPEGQTILLFRECYALEKIHGTSAHIRLSVTSGVPVVTFSPGGEKHERFVALFDGLDLLNRFEKLGHQTVVVYGEAYGGKQQKQAWRYGTDLRFVAFDVLVGDLWMTVPNAADICAKLGLEFVHYERVSTDLASLDAQRDAPSTQARRNGVEGDKPREGVVLRPLIEMTMNNGERICAKHKRDEERETASPRKVVDPSQLEVLSAANDIALEWVTETRLEHVIDRRRAFKYASAAEFGGDRPLTIADTGEIVKAMVEDVLREGAGEIVDSKEARAAISRRTAELFRASLKARA